MKKIISCMIVLIVSVASFSQQLKPQSALTAQDYLKKSKQQKNIMYAISIPGSLIFLIGGVMSMSEYGDGLNFFDSSGYDEKKAKTGDALMIAGGIIVVASLPFNYAARRNEKKAMTILVKDEHVQHLWKNGFIAKPIPSLTLKISL